MDLTNVANSKKNYFEKKIRPLLIYVGTFGAILMTVAYIIAVFVLIFGFKANLSLKQAISFAIANAVVGMLIMFFLKIQGKDFAKTLTENKPIVEAYYGNKTKDKKILSMKYYWIKSTIIDFTTKVLTIVATTTVVIKIAYEGNGDLALLGIAAVNILTFICFGLLSLVRAYDFYNEFHVPYMKEQLKLQGFDLKNLEKNDIIIEEKMEEKSNE